MSARKPRSPSSTMRSAKERIAEASKVPLPDLPSGRHPASDAAEEAGRARRSVGELPVPMTLSEICALMGVGCEPENFAPTAFESLAGQLEAAATFAENEGSYDGWRVINNIAERMKCAGNVARWLETETTDAAEVVS